MGSHSLGPMDLSSALLRHSLSCRSRIFSGTEFFCLNSVSFSAPGGPPAALCARQGEALQQQGHHAAGESLLPSLARSWWERDGALINRGGNSLGGEAHEQGCLWFLHREAEGRGRHRSCSRLILLAGLHWSSLEIV